MIHCTSMSIECEVGRKRCMKEVPIWPRQSKKKGCEAHEGSSMADNSRRGVKGKRPPWPRRGKNTSHPQCQLQFDISKLIGKLKNFQLMARRSANLCSHLGSIYTMLPLWGKSSFSSISSFNHWFLSRTPFQIDGVKA